MTSTLRAALAPLFKISAAIARAYESLSAGGQTALAILWLSVEHARCIDPAEAARLLLGMGPLMLDVAADAPTETVVRNAAKVMMDAVALMQREEIRTILQAVSRETEKRGGFAIHARMIADCALPCGCLLQSVALAQSQPVRDLVVDSSSTLLSLLHALQSPSVTRVRQQLEASLACLLGVSNATKQSAVSSSTGSHTHGSDLEAVGLGESVQLLLLIESVSLVDSSDSSSSSCSCPPHLPRALRQRYLDEAESRWLRGLARLQDLQLCMLLRFVRQAPLPPQIAATVDAAPLEEKQQPASALEDDQQEGAPSSAADPRSAPLSNGRSLSVDDASLSRAVTAAAAASSSPSLSHYSRSRRASADDAAALRKPRVSLVDQIRAEAEARALRARIDASEAEEHAPFSGSEGSSDDEGLPHARSRPRRQFSSSASAPSSSFFSQPQSASSFPPARCAVHAPMVHARFLHCVREMMADRQWKEE